ncbi:sugar ABC transporter permease [Sphaerisporangium melleum]|uniref:Sugar ABC transporter permease n=1 Tax=Sphaerisporangium melleum TaxID=321316 RepID=A0A917QS01_9ACTN|nr:sugar ABC transporter permease [Sphaerisporangium melleum]GGK64329.1 sugar ABC transporter permease [Sphaerisporangium melleum]GII70101.1 sugar ABC transporter permease [Sphaerisporangium melleum]
MTSTTTTPARRLGRRRAGVSEPGAGWALVFIAPAVIGLAALYLWPFLSTFVKSFQDVPAFGPATFVGAGNYTALLGDEEFWKAFGNSALYTAIILLGVPLAVVLAALVEQAGRGRAVYRVLFFLPVVTLPVAVGMVWRFIYNGDFGLLNTVLAWFGVHGQFWVADARFTIYAFGVVGIWMSLGINMIILGAGLQAVPKDLYEAASLDGAGRVRQFFHITVPLLTPSIFFVTILSVIGALQMFDLIFVMLRGVNNTALADSKTIVYLFYEKAFVQFDQGYGAAVAIVLLIVIMIATAVQFRLQRRWVFYG